MSLKKIIYFFILLSGVIVNPVSADLPFYFPKAINVSSDTDFVLSIRNMSEINLPVEIYYKPIYALSWKSKNAIFSGEDFRITLPAPMKEEIFEWYIQSGDIRMPKEEGSFKVYTSSGEVFFKEEALKFITEQQSNADYCRPYSGSTGYNCMLGNMHAEEALRFAYAYDSTRNESLKNISMRLIFSRYYNKTPYLPQYCDHYQDDYDCDLADGNFGYQIPGAEKKGIMIYSFVRAYQLLGDLSVLNHAHKYAEGSAGECDVWSNDFDCMASQSQGAMILGYWKIYENMPLEKYWSIARKLTDRGLSYPSSPYLLMGLSKAYEMTGNASYLKKMDLVAQDLYEICRTTPCDPATQAKHIQAFYYAFLQSGNRHYQKNALDKILAGTSSSCDPMDQKYICFDSEEQGKLNQAYFFAFSYSHSESKFLNPRLKEKPYPGKGAILSFSSQGYIRNPVINIKGPKELFWSTYDLAYQDNEFILPPEDSIATGMYRFFFSSDSGARWPKGNATFSFIIPEYNPLLALLTEGVSNTDPMNRCDPHGTNPLTSDFACRNEVFQGWQILGFNEYLRITNESLVKQKQFGIISNLSHTKIDDLENESFFGDRRTTCEYVLDEYSCLEYAQYVADPNREEGAKRQALQILSALETYHLTNNNSFRERAIRFLEEAPGECNPLGGDFLCGSQETQGLIALAYLEAYNILGDKRYLDFGINLSLPILGSEPEPFSVLALWKLYLYTSEIDFFIAARNKSLVLSELCIQSFSCTQKDLMKNLIVMWESFLNSPSDDFFSYSAQLKSMIIEPSDKDFTCNPLQGSYSCLKPDEQGITMIGLSKSFLSYYNQENLTVKINISAPQRVDYLSDFPVQCIVKNTGNGSASYDLFIVAGGSSIINVSTSGTFSSLDKISFIGHSPNEEIMTTWYIRADIGGPVDFRCAIIPTFVNSTEVIVDNIFDVLTIDSTKEAWVKIGELAKNNYSIRNNVSFPLFNLTIDLRLFSDQVQINDSSIELFNLTSDTIIFTNLTGFIPTLLPNQIADFEISFISDRQGDYMLGINVSTAYGGNESFLQKIYSYDLVYLDNNSIPSLCVIRSIFDVVYRLRNNESFNLSHLTFSFIPPPFFITLNSSFSGGEISSINSTHSFLSLLESGQEIELTYTVYSFDSLEGYFNFSASSEISRISYHDTSQVSCINETFDLNIVLNPPSIVSFESGVPQSFGLSANISNIISMNLTDIIIQAILGNGLEIISVYPNTTIEENIKIFFESGNSTIDSLINSTDNTSLILDDSSIQLIFDDTWVTDIRSRNLSITYNSTIPFTGSVWNATNEVSHCFFPSSQRQATHSCDIGIGGEMLNITLHGGTAYIDNVYLEIIYGFLVKEGRRIGEMIEFSSLEPGETANFGWDFLLNSSDNTHMVIKAVSSENGYISKQINFTAFSLPKPEILERGSSSGGFGSKIIKNETYQENVTFLDFSSQDTLRFIYDHPQMKENLSLWHEKSGFFNSTEMLKDCLLGERIIKENKIMLRFTSFCEDIFDDFSVYDIIDKSVFYSTDLVNITQSKGSYQVIRKDPELFFNYGALHPGEAVWHSYEPVDIQGTFFVPFIIGRNFIRLNETAINQTADNATEIPGVISKESTTESSSKKKERFSGLDQMFFFIHTNLQKISFWFFIISLLIILLIAHPIRRLRKMSQGMERKRDSYNNKRGALFPYLIQKTAETGKYFIFMMKRQMVKIQIRSLSYINDRRRERIGSSFAQVKSYPDSKISFWTVSQDTYFLAQEVKDSPDLSSVFQTIRNNLTLLKTLSEKERIDKEHLEIFLARIKIEIMIGIEQRDDRSDAIQLFSIFHSIFGNYEPEKVFSAYAGKEEKSIISRMVGKTSPFLDGSAQNSVIEDRAEMDGISNKSYSDGSDSGESHLGKEHKSVVEQSEDAQNRIEDLYFLAQYINEQLIKGNSDKLESQIDRLRTLSESVTNDLESAKPSIKDFYNLHIRQLVDNLFMDYEKK